MSAFIDMKRASFGVQPICETLGVSASAFYHRASGAKSARVLEDERVLALIRVIYAENYEAYGYRRVWKEARRRGHTGVPRCQVQRLMAEHDIRGAKRRGKPWRTTVADPAAAERPDLVNRDFTASRPGELFVADFTYVRCWQGTVFFAFVLDVYSRRILGWPRPSIRKVSHRRVLAVALAGMATRRTAAARNGARKRSIAGSVPGRATCELPRPDRCPASGLPQIRRRASACRSGRM